jgi:hypothetical protein
VISWVVIGLVVVAVIWFAAAVAGAMDEYEREKFDGR